MSNDPHHWMHFYQLGHATRFPPQLGSATESTVVSTLSQSASASATSSPPATHANPSASGSGGGSTSLNPEGGVTKPARRRNRVSRRTPTTIMNTDTTNFRAIVQQFTGAPPNTTFGSGHGPNMLSFGFGRGHAPASGLGHVQYSHQQQYEHQQYNNLLSLNTNNNNNTTSHSNHFSLEGIGSSPRGSVPMTAVEGVYHQGVLRRSSSSDDNGGNNNNNNNYIF